MKVLLVNMPFGSVRPAIGTSLLKARLAEMGVACKILYLNIVFSKLVGGDDYHYVSDTAPSQSLAGDWVFSESAFGRCEERDEAYLASLRERFVRFGAGAAAIERLKRCRALSGGFIDSCLNDVDWASYDVVGFTSTFAQHVASLALARRVKDRHPDVRIVFGGANCEQAMGLQLHRLFPFIDFVFSGEADVSFPKFIANLGAPEKCAAIPGVIYRDGGESKFVSLQPERVSRLDDLPYPDYEDYFEQMKAIYPNHNARRLVLMETSRGCWWGEKHHCTFCGLNGTSMAFRSKSSGRVLAEIDHFQGHYGAEFVEMVDNIMDMKYFDHLIPALAARGVRLGLFYETKANLRKDQLEAMRRAGIESIQPGLESLSSDVLKLMNKGTTAVQNVQLLKWCKELGIRPLWNLLYGFPGESPEHYEKTAETMQFIRHLEPPVGFGAIRLDRFSPNFEKAQALGIRQVRPDRSYGYIYGLEPEQLFDFSYYFEHGYEDGRLPETYVESAYEAFLKWQREPRNQGLVYCDHGDSLAIWDFRSGAARTLTILDGIERELYLYCDQHRSTAQVAEFLARHGFSGSAADITGPRIGDRTMLFLDSHFLSLAVRKQTASS